MLKTTVDLAHAVMVLTEIVARFGADHRAAGTGVSGCVYTTGGDGAAGLGDTDRPHRRLSPVCIVGQVFDYYGIMRALLNEHAMEYGACSPDGPMWFNAEAMGVTFTPEAQRFLRAAQSYQDSNKTWGEALSKAITDARDAALEDFKSSSPLFTYLGASALALAAGQEPLAEWEWELVNGGPLDQD